MVQFLRMFGFERFSNEIKQQWISRYGSNQQIIREEEYRWVLEEYGLEIVELQRFMSKPLTSYTYFTDLLDNILQTNSFRQTGSTEFDDALLQFTEKSLCPLLAMDNELCSKPSSGSYLFIVAKKRGTKIRNSSIDILDNLRCPIDHSPLKRTREIYRSQATGNDYPIVEDVPLLIPFYANWYKSNRSKLKRNSAA